MLKRFCDWTILAKIMAIPVVSLLVMLVAVQFFVVPFMEKKVMENKKGATRQVVEIAFGLVEGYARKAEAGLLRPEDARAQAMAAIKSLRYSGKEYFWINDTTPRMVMHPTKPELDGQDLTEHKDPNGMRLFVEFAKVAKEKGSGFVDYLWPKPGEPQAVQKTSYVKLYAPWGWIIGSGIYVDDVKKEVRTLQLCIYGAATVFILFLVLFATYVGIGITRPLNAVVRQLHDLSSGDADLTKRIEVDRRDESGKLAEAFNVFLSNMQNLISKVRTSATSVAESAYDLKQRSALMAGHAEQVVSEASAVAAAGEEMAATANVIASNCQTAVEASKTTSLFAQDGASVVQHTMSVMSRIAEQVQASSATVSNLMEKSDQIGAIIGTIEDIADQTNLLALNAAIEAARAGDQGRGFAVVADEVRALAERTTTATKEITTMISAIQRETQGAVNIMNEGVSRVQEGTSEASKSGASLDQILSQVDQVMQQIDQIAMAAEEQTSTTSGISNSIDRITAQAGNECSLAGDMAGAADRLNRLAEEMISSVNRFQTIITWSNWMSVHVSSLDDDHKRLIDMIGRLNGAMERGQGDKVIDEILMSLEAYCREHFSREEELMKRYGYPDYAQHKEVHDAFSRKVSEAIRACHEKQVSPSSVMSLLSDWFTTHILDVDKRYGDFFVAKKCA